MFWRMFRQSWNSQPYLKLSTQKIYKPISVQVCFIYIRLYKYTLCHFHHAEPSSMFICYIFLLLKTCQYQWISPAENLALLPIPFGARFVISLLSIFRRLSLKSFHLWNVSDSFSSHAKDSQLERMMQKCSNDDLSFRNSKVINLYNYISWNAWKPQLVI